MTNHILKIHYDKNSLRLFVVTAA